MYAVHMELFNQIIMSRLYNNTHSHVSQYVWQIECINYRSWRLE